MAYIWENYSESTVYQIENASSPYIEILPGNSQIQYVNPLLRFACIFDALSALKYDEFGKEDFQNCILGNFNNADIENILFHYLASVDRLAGMDKQQIKADALEREIMTGAFGSFVCENWHVIKKRDQVIILNAMVSKFCSIFVDNYFFIAIQQLFERVSMIFEKDTEIYYLYISDAGSSYNEMLAKMVELLLWNIQCRLQIVWHNHYGIIGEEDTMRISDIKII